MSDTAVESKHEPRAIRRKYTGNLESVREKIQTSQLINRLNGFALQHEDPQTGKPVEMSATQVKAAIALLKKTVPDLTQVEMSAEVALTRHEEGLSELE